MKYYCARANRVVIRGNVNISGNLGVVVERNKYAFWPFAGIFIWSFKADLTNLAILFAKMKNLFDLHQINVQNTC